MEENSKKVGNPKTKVDDVTIFNDQDILHDVLCSCKMLGNLYSTFLYETSNNELFSDIEDLLQEISSEQRSIFDLTFELGWYQLEKENKTKITQTVKQFNQRKNELNY